MILWRNNFSAALAMANVFQYLVFEEGSKGSGAFGVAGRADPPLFAAESEQVLASAVIALEPGEARVRDSTVKVTSHNRVDEASPEAVFFFESLLPNGLDIFVVGLEELIQSGVLGLSRSVEGERWVGLGMWQPAP